MAAGKTRYDRRRLLACLDEVVTDDVGLSVVIIPDGDPQPFVVDVTRRWLTQVLTECIRGESPDLGAFPDLCLTAHSDQNDFRRKVFTKATEMALSQPAVVPIGQPLKRAGALQTISDGKLPHTRINSAVEGVLWAIVRPNWLEVGFELNRDERALASHMTILEGHIEEENAALVNWNVGPSIVRAASPQKLMSMMNQSLPVDGARERWGGLSTRIDPEEIRSLYWEASVVEARHPSRIGSYILDHIDDRRKRPILESDLSDRESVLYDQPCRSDEADVDLQLAEDRSSLVSRLSRLSEITDDSEKQLLDALAEAWKEDDSLSVREIAERNGWEPANVDAVLKRLRRKADKIG